MTTTRMLLVSLVAGLGCSSDNTTANLNPGPDAGTTPSGDGGTTTSQLNDAQMLAALIAANQGAVQVSMPAQPNLTNADAAAFAATVIGAHAPAADREQALADDLEITPEPSFATTLVMTTVQSDLAALAG